MDMKKVVEIRKDIFPRTLIGKIISFVGVIILCLGVGYARGIVGFQPKEVSELYAFGSIGVCLSLLVIAYFIEKIILKVKEVLKRPKGLNTDK